MADLHERNDARLVVDREDSAIVGLPNAIGVVNAGQLLAARRTRVKGKSLQRGGEALRRFLGSTCSSSFVALTFMTSL